jgi:hypothetical protein
MLLPLALPPAFEMEHEIGLEGLVFARIGVTVQVTVIHKNPVSYFLRKHLNPGIRLLPPQQNDSATVTSLQTRLATNVPATVSV